MARQARPTFETENEIFPTRLRELMSIKGINQAQLGEEIGVRRQTISLYTTGQSKPDWEQISRICTFLECSSDYLLGLSDFVSKENKDKNDELYENLSDLISRLFDESDQRRVRHVLNQVLDGFKAAVWCDGVSYMFFETTMSHVTVALMALAECAAYIAELDMEGLSDEEQAERFTRIDTIMDEATNNAMKRISRLSGKYRELALNKFPNLIDSDEFSFSYAHKITQLMSEDGITFEGHSEGKGN